MDAVATDCLLSLVDVNKHFGGAKALSNVSVNFHAGDVHSLVGENGAGKSTLGKILLGAHQPDNGEIYLDGKPISLTNPAKGNALGLVGIAQELSLLQNRSVADNIAMGQEVTRGFFIDEKSNRKKVLDTMEHYNMFLDPDTLVGSLSVAEQQKVEILRALSRDARLIVFDEPTARLASHEAEKLLELIQRLSESGKAIVYVSHFLDEVLSISDTITVLRNSELIRTNDAKNETKDSLVMAVTGQEMKNQFPPLPKLHSSESPILSVDNISVNGVFEDVSLNIYPGEIVGLAGLVGSGRSDVAHAIYGSTALDKGSVILHGENLTKQSIVAHIKSGMALIPESRRDQGLMSFRPILENITLPHLHKFMDLTGLNKSREQRLAIEKSDETRLKHNGLDNVVSSLSGGNQQKVLFARAAMGNPSLVIADEPTRGVDVGAKRSIYELLLKLAENGTGILLISSEIEEILGLCHRVLVMSQGAVVAELDNEHLTERAVMQAAFHGGK